MRVGEETIDPSKLPPGSIAIAPHGGSWFDVVWIVWPDGTSGESLGQRRRQPRGLHHGAFGWSSGPWVVLAMNLSPEDCDFVAEGSSFIEMKRRAVTLSSFKPLQTKRRMWATFENAPSFQENYHTMRIQAYHDPEMGEKLQLRPKDIERASKDGKYTVVVRAQPEGGFLVMSVSIEDSIIRGREFVEERTNVPRAITSLLRDMDKFYGQGGNYSYSGRHRDKRNDKDRRAAVDFSSVEDIVQYIERRLPSTGPNIKVEFDYETDPNSGTGITIHITFTVEGKTRKTTVVISGDDWWYGRPIPPVLHIPNLLRDIPVDFYPGNRPIQGFEGSPKETADFMVRWLRDFVARIKGVLDGSVQIRQEKRNPLRPMMPSRNRARPVTAILQRATKDPEFRRKAIAFLSRKALRNLIQVEELPSPQKHIVEMLARHGLTLMQAVDGVLGYTLQFEPGTLSLRTLRPLFMSQAIRWIELDGPSAIKYFPEMGMWIDRKVRLSKNEVAPLLLGDHLSRGITFRSFSIGC